MRTARRGNQQPLAAAGRREQTLIAVGDFISVCDLAGARSARAATREEFGQAASFPIDDKAIVVERENDK